LTLQTAFAAPWCFWFSANDTSVEQVCQYLVYIMCKNVSEKQALLLIKCIPCNQCSLN